MPLGLLNDLEKKKQFLLANEDYLLKSASLWCGLTQQQLRKYKTILQWNFISANHNIKWNTDIIDEFKKEIFKEENQFDFNYNDSLPWEIEFIERYIDLWDWGYLAQNPKVMGNPKIKKHFHNQLYSFYKASTESRSFKYNGINGSVLTYGEEVESSFDIFKKQKELQFQHPNEIIKAKSINWLRLSQNTLLPWSAELIEQFIDKWDWSQLSTNESVPWDMELIKKFEHKIDWTIDITDKNGVTTLNGTSISNNMGIEWDSLLLSSFLTKLNKWDISISGNAKWDIDLLIRFSEFWEYNTLSLNRIVWSKVFPEFDSEEHLLPLLDLIIENKHSNNPAN